MDLTAELDKEAAAAPTCRSRRRRLARAVWPYVERHKVAHEVAQRLIDAGRVQRDADRQLEAQADPAARPVEVIARSPV